jgi:hypothetical protein
VKWGYQNWEEMMIGYFEIGFQTKAGKRPRVDVSRSA